MINAVLTIPEALWPLIITPSVKDSRDLKTLEALPEKDLQSSVQRAIALSSTCKELQRLCGNHLSALKTEHEHRKLIASGAWAKCKINLVYYFCIKNQIKRNSSTKENLKNPYIYECGFPKDNDRLKIENLFKEYGPEVKELHIDNCLIKKPSTHIFSFLNITTLNMSNNYIVNINFIEKLPTLKEVSFFRNNISEITASHSGLEKLNLGSNCIVSLPENLESLFPSLEDIFLYENSLITLNIKHNRIKYIDAGANKIEEVLLDCNLLETLRITDNLSKIRKIAIKTDDLFELNIDKKK